MYDKYGQLIDGKWQKSASGETYEVMNLATEEVIGKALKANSSVVQNAFKSAEKGLEIWKNTYPWERSRIIRKISDLIKNSSEFYDLSYEYINDCLRAGLVYRREFYNDSEIEPENSLMFTITLNTFGSINSPTFSQ